MLFNSLQFLFFFIIVSILYWGLPHRSRWVLLLVASCYFYMTFIPSYIFIIGFTVVIDYIAGLMMDRIKHTGWRKTVLVVSLISNIGILCFFKYVDFFDHALGQVIGQPPFPYLGFLLPVGLSFHTFQAMSYTIEVYRKNYPAEKHFGIYALYVMFYPQLVAGPIERPQNILWQFHKEQKFDTGQFKSGLMQMAFGLFKKVVIADRIAEIVDKAYAHPNQQNGRTFLIVSILYSFQIYCDFSGYSDIGIGAARTMGYKLVNNFNAPYLSRSLGEFWSRWHLSLSTWFRDYLYIPLGGSRVKSIFKYRNLLIVFLVSGLWHGANWTFIVWGLMHGTLLIIENLAKDKSNKASKIESIGASTLKAVATFSLVTLLWIYFRAPNVNTAWRVVREIFSSSVLHPFNQEVANFGLLVYCALLIVILMLKDRYMAIIPTRNNWVFYGVLSMLVICCYLFGVFNHKQFIYFQF